MGCWNETCGISNLPILAGEKIRVFLLARGRADSWKHGGTHYIDDLWMPLSMGIRAKYNDYGGVEEVVVESKALLAAIELGEDAGEIETCINEISRGGTTSTLGRDEVNVSHMMVIEEIHQSMVDFSPVEAHFSKKNGYTYRPRREIFEREMDDWYPLSKLYLDGRGYMLDRGGLFYNRRSHCLDPYKNKLATLSASGVGLRDSIVAELVGDLVEFSLFSSSMVDLRKMWLPQTGRGSQNMEMDIHLSVCESVRSVVEKRKTDFSHDGLDERDSNGYYQYMIEHNNKRKSS